MRIAWVAVVVLLVAFSVSVAAHGGKEKGRDRDRDDDDAPRLEEKAAEENDAVSTLMRDILGAKAKKQDTKPAAAPPSASPELSEPPPSASGGLGIPTLPVAGSSFRPAPAVAIVVGLAAVGAAGFAALRARQHSPAASLARGVDPEGFAAGRALAIRQPDPLASMPKLGLGSPEVLEDGPRGGIVLVRGTPPDGGCSIRAGYIAGSLGGEVSEVSHGVSSCEFEIRR